MDQENLPLDFQFAVKHEKKTVQGNMEKYFYSSAFYQHDAVNDIVTSYKPVAVYFDSAVLQIEQINP